MKIRIIPILGLFLVLGSFAVAFYFYPQMPDEMISHWNAQGEPDGYMSKCGAIFLMPLISVFLFLLFLVLPKIDPLKENIKKFRKYYELFIFIILLFLFYIYILSILLNSGFQFDLGRYMVPAMGLLFLFIGFLLEKAERNWFIGLRTPWTLSDERVWKETHKLGAKLFKISALIAFLGIIFPSHMLWFVLAPVLLSSIITLVYSYSLFQKLQDKS